jgi:RNA recognition motif-containing protein
MENKLFVGNLPWSVDDSALAGMFEEYGEIASARVMTERDSGRSRGFGFVEFNDEASAQKAIEAMDGKELEGRALTVNIARPARQ